MTLIFPDTRGNQPSTHALIIGVGGYRYLLNGEEENQQVLNHVGLLDQLTSPPRSAAAFAQHMLDTQADWRVPLGSIELLVSPAPQDPDPLPAGMQTDPASIANIATAYGEWKKRCDRHADNIAIFYFCGHGLEKTEQYLLAEDFGANPNAPWLGAFSFDLTRLAFHDCIASTQCFFIDACRKMTSEMLPARLIVPGLETMYEGIPDCSYNLTMKASARNESSLGPKKNVSYFTQALLKALKGAAASQGPAGWVVESGQLAAQITTILRSIKETEGYVQRCSCEVIDNTELLRINVTPKVKLNLVCFPDKANDCVELVCAKPGDSGTSHTGAPWSLEVDAGFYMAKASFKQGQYMNVSRDIIVTPPKHDCSLRVG